MFEKYSCPNPSKINHLERDYALFQKLFCTPVFYDTMRKQRAYPTPYKQFQRYTIKQELETLSQDTYKLFLRYNSPDNLRVLERQQYALKPPYSLWSIMQLNDDELLKVFPQGLPTTEKQMKRWISYIGYLAKEQRKSTIERYEKQVDVYDKLIDTVYREVEKLKLNRHKTIQITKAIREIL